MKKIIIIFHYRSNNCIKLDIESARGKTEMIPN